MNEVVGDKRQVVDGSFAWYALKLRSYGFAPIVVNFPLFDNAGIAVGCSCSRRHACPQKSWGKHPRNTGWQEHKELFLDPVKIGEQFSHCHPRSNIGTVTGLISGNVIIDVDVGPGKNGLVTFAELEKKYGALPPTVTVVTGSGGFQYHLRHTRHEFKNSAGKLGNGIDIRAKGGQGLLPPSWNAKGQYRFHDGRRPSEVEIAALPQNWVEFLLAKGAEAPADRVWNDAKGAETPVDRVWKDRAWFYVRRAPFWEKEEDEQLDELALELFAKMARHPAMLWMKAHPNDVTREVWRGAATNIAALCLGRSEEVVRAGLAFFHGLSKPYQGYSPRETTTVFVDALNSAATVGPMSFDHMTDHGLPIELWDSGFTNIIHAVREGE